MSGFRTNHLLHATAATRQYRSGIDEQMIVERTLQEKCFFYNPCLQSTTAVGNIS